MYINSKNLLSRLKSEEKIEIKFIKSIAMIYIYNKFSELEPTPEVMKSILNLENIDSITETLRSKNLLVYRKHYNHYKLTEDIDVNIDKEIKEYIENKLGNFNYIETLEENLKMSVYYPLKYNDENKITRYMGRYYLDVSDSSKLDQIMENKIEDGKIIYLTNIEDNPDYIKIKDFLLKKDLVLVSNKYGKKLDIINLLKELEAINSLKIQENKYLVEGILKNELETYKDEVLEKLNTEIETYFLDGIIGKNKSLNKLNLMNFTEKYLKNKYPKYIGVNYELINKNNLSFPMKKARYEILTKLSNQEILDDETYFNKTTAESSVARILLKNENIYRLGDINLENSIYLTVYNEVLEKIKKEKINMGEIYEIYTSNRGEYGIRRGIFTFILGLLIIKNNKFIGINMKLSQGEMELDLKMLDDIEKNPNRYEMFYYPMGEEEIEYIQTLYDLFKFYIPQNKDADVNKVLAGIKNYVISLPRYANNICLRKNKKLNKLFSGIFTINNAREFILIKIPKIYREESLIEVTKKIKLDMEMLEKEKTKLKESLIKFILSSLGSEANFKNLIKKLKNKKAINEIEKYIITLKSYTDDEILLKITERIKGFSYENWRSEKDIEEFKERFRLELKKDGINQNEISKGQLNIEHNDKNITVDMNIKESIIGKMLKNKLKVTIKNMGQSITQEEKKKILAEILLGEEE